MLHQKTNCISESRRHHVRCVAQEYCAVVSSPDECIVFVCVQLFLFQRNLTTVKLLVFLYKIKKTYFLININNLPSY